MVRSRRRHDGTSRRRDAAHRLAGARPGLSLRAERRLAHDRVPALGPSARRGRLARQVGADPGARLGSRVRARGGFAQSPDPDGRTAPALHVHPVPRPDGPSDLRYGPARPESRAALPQQPLRRRGPARRRERARRGTDDAAPARGQRTAIPHRDHRPALLFREPAGRAAGRSGGDAKRVEPRGRDRTHGLARLERARRHGIRRRGVEHAPRRGGPAVPAATGHRREPGLSLSRGPARTMGRRGRLAALAVLAGLRAAGLFDSRKTSRSTASPVSSTGAAAGAFACSGGTTFRTARAKATIPCSCRWNSPASRRSEPATILSWNAAFGDTPPPPQPPYPDATE